MGALGTGGIYEAATEQMGCCKGMAAASLDGAPGSAASAAGFNPDNPYIYTAVSADGLCEGTPCPADQAGSSHGSQGGTSLALPGGFGWSHV